ncbi:helix-turn-helix domain-containing protein [Pullulanibacillus sp. KACC 23026]|uniref:helix-turn-helix domain-containing protein n=1 Tax=Pullulanibacillus sp. KACC 23026 TaxID=3028315 RepID=UPI0023AF187E|nr:helix-turn-helix domain-containing protein [Pullulanibacillus sp. KACC 23026]WEG14445.1 helix-turn-helix domain-containing protein [Pullulanibacillus sp. KACC 23026]
MKNYVMALSIVCLAISIVIGSWLISKGLSSENKNSSAEITHSHQLLTLKQVSSYLGLSQKDVLKLISAKGREIEPDFPHIKIGKTYYFNENAVNNWVQKSELEIP